MLSSRRRLAGVLILAALATAHVASVRAYHDEDRDGDCDREVDEMVLAFSMMVGNPGNVSINNVPGASVPWTVEDCDGVLLSDGTLRIRVRGLVLASSGTNPNATFAAIVSCTTLDSSNDPVIETVSTGEFTATAAGHCHIKGTVTLPSPCIAPVVYIADPNGNWLAATGL